MDLKPPFVPSETHPAYHRYGPDQPSSPIVIAVPHAGRDYPAELMQQAAVSEAILSRLEDRHADLLAYRLIAAGHCVLIARPARAMIDFNRDEADLDPGMIRGFPPGQPIRASAKQRGGLGLLPRRLPGPGGGELWRGRLDWPTVSRRIQGLHQPYHAALGGMLARARASFGQALLFDLHSMPPLAATAGELPAGVVLGDRFGRSAGGWISGLALSLVEGRGLIAAQNHPYPGSHTLDRHGRPERGVHAVQCEVDRSLYLEPGLRGPGPGLAEMQAHMLAIVSELADALTPEGYSQAAE